MKKFIYIFLVITILLISTYILAVNYSSNIYEITLTIPEGSNEIPKLSRGPSLVKYLNNRLNLNKEKQLYIFNKIDTEYFIYSSDRTYDIFDTPFYQNREITIYAYIGNVIFLRGINKSDGNYNLNIRKSKKKISPYLQDNKYCESDLDCILRVDFCNLQPYNTYAKIYPHAYECMSIFTDTGYDYENECSYEITYSNLKCLNNTCIGDSKRGSYCMTDQEWQKLF